MEDRRRRTFPRAHHEQAGALSSVPAERRTSPSRAITTTPPALAATNVYFYSQRGASKPLGRQRSRQQAATAQPLLATTRSASGGRADSSFRPVLGRQTTSVSSSPPLSSTRPPRPALPLPADDTLRARLHEVRHLFLCCRDLLSIHHIQYLALMPQLEQLNLHMNLIKHVEGLSPLRCLVELDLSANEIRDLDAEAFTGLHQLRRLNLSSNFLTHLPQAVLSPLRSLEWLSLGFNELADVEGLVDIPADAPLASVDLCGNQIPTLTEMARALMGHATTLQELRLEVPKTSTLLATQESAEDPLLAVIAAVQRPPHLFTRENPCCAHALYYRKPAAVAAATPAGKENLARGTRDIKPAVLRASDPLSVLEEDDTAVGGHYAEALMRFFPRLVVLNGVSFGLDPLLMRPLRAPSGQSPSAVAAPPATVLAGLSPDSFMPAYPVRWRDGPAPQTPVARALGFDDHRNHRHRATSASSSSALSSSRSCSSSSSSSSSTPPRRSKPRQRRPHRDGAKRLADDTAARVDTTASTHNITPEQPKPAPTTSSSTSPSLGASPIVEAAPPLALFSPPRVYAASAVAPVAEPGAEPAGRRDSQESGESRSRSGSCSEVLVPLKKDTSPLASLKWRPKRVSRGTNTEVSLVAGTTTHTTAVADKDGDDDVVDDNDKAPATPTTRTRPAASETPVRILERELAHRCEELEHGEVRLQRAREQLSLRVAVEVDLRRQLSLVHQRCLEVETAKETQAVHLRAQVMALKDELTRRAQEAQLMTRQHRVELEAARAKDGERQVLEAALAEQVAAVAELRDGWQRDQQCAAETVARIESEKAEWEHNAALWQHECETAEAQHNEARVCLERAHAQAMQAASSAIRTQLAATAALAEEERAARQQLERRAWMAWSHQTGPALTAAWQAEVGRTRAPLQAQLTAVMEAREALQEQLAVVQAQYQEALQHAEQELVDLRQALADKPTTTVAPSFIPPSTPRVSEATATATADVSSSTADRPHTEALSSAGVHSTAAYWKETCKCREAALTRLNEALRISQESYQALSDENSRLLQQIQEELPQRYQAEATVLESERANLLRTVHNLQEDLGKKDHNMQALEKEAREKIDAKRQRIAELEEENEDLRERQAVATQQAVRLRDELTQAQRRAEALEQSAAGRDHGAAEEKMALVQALRMAREQLVAVHEAHSALLREQHTLKEQGVRREAELDECKRAYRALQDDARARQKATFDAFSRMMMMTTTSPTTDGGNPL